MPGGGLLQLISYGIQDIYLTGNPNAHFYDYVYNRVVYNNLMDSKIKKMVPYSIYCIEKYILEKDIK